MSYERHLRSRYAAQATEISSRAKLYLDLRFWLILRDADRGESSNDEVHLLLAELRAGVESGALVCPLSDAIFAELLKQEDPVSRRHTAALIDELSLGATLRPIEFRIYEEILHAICVFWDGAAIRSASDFVWTCPSAMVGLDLPPPPHVQSALRPEYFLDKVWAVPLTEVLATAGHLLTTETPFTEAFADATTRDSALHAQELRSFQAAYDSEVRGVVEVMAPMARQAMNALAVDQGYSPPASLSRDMNNALLNTMHILLTEGRSSQLLPTARVLASLHAAHRWDKQRRFHRNDFYDYYHAAAAFAYCDGFFVERSLGSLVATRHVKLPRSSECLVASDIGACTAIVRSKVGQR